MNRYLWKSFCKGIKLIPKKCKDHKTAQQAEKFVHFIIEKNKQTQTCMAHVFNYALFTPTYRLYRRGKNRCKWCGVKTNIKDWRFGRGTSSQS